MAVIDLNRAVATPPAGLDSNFENPPNEAALAYAALALALFTVTFFAWFRFLVKVYIMQKLHPEDYLIPFAWVAAIVHIACGFIINEFAPIVHSWDLTMRTFGRYLLWYHISSIFYNIAIVLIKVAILIQVMRIFVPRGAQSKTYFVVHGPIWMNVLYYTITVFLMSFNCQPLSKAWEPWIPGKCLNIGAIALSTAVVNLVGDLAILFLTQKVIWSLMRVDRRQRLNLSLVFMAGIVPCGFAIMCLYYNARQMRTNDFTRDSYYMTIACYGEIASGMFVLFLSIVPKFFKHVKTATSGFSLLPSSKRSRGGTIGSSMQDGTKEKGGRKSLFHISYTERAGGSEERLASAIHVTTAVSVRSETLGVDDGIEMVGRGRGVEGM